MKSRIAYNGARVSCEEFTSTKRYECSKEEMERILALPLTDYKTLNIEDGDTYEWYEVGCGKYDRNMYCPKTDTLRGQTMGEFYGNSTVD